MSDRAYHLSQHEKAPILEACLTGFWWSQDRKDFSTALIGSIELLRQSGRPFGVLFDLRAFDVQSAANVDAMKMASSPGSGHKRAPSAIVSGRALVKLQASRVFTLGATRVFATREEAIDWLVGELAESLPLS